MTAPLREVKTNLARSTLNGAINNSVTSVVLTSGSTFPSTGNFRIVVEDEIMIATARSTNTLTVIRGQEGTTAASHADTTQVDHVVTRDCLARLACDNWATFNYGRAVNKLVDTNGTTILTDSDFGWVNQETATAADQAGTILLRCPKSGGIDWRIRTRTKDSSPVAYIAGIQSCITAENNTDRNHHFGMGFRQSSSDKMVAMQYKTQPPTSSTDSHILRVVQSSNANSSSLIISRAEHAIATVAQIIYMRVEDDGTNISFHIGMDSENFIEIHSEDRDSYMTSGGPDQVFWYGQTEGTDDSDGLVRLVHWSTE